MVNKCGGNVLLMSVKRREAKRKSFLTKKSQFCSSSEKSFTFAPRKY
jgi:hypothetical protein